MNNLTQTQQDVKQTFFNNHKFEIFACYEKADTEERNAIITYIDEFLSVCNSEQERFWRNIKRRLNSINEIAVEELIFKPKSWTQKTIDYHDFKDGEMIQREDFEKDLPQIQAGWKNTALENLRQEPNFYKKLTEDGKLDHYLWKAVKEATLIALYGILNRYALEEMEEHISWALMTPDDDRPAMRYVLSNQDTQSDYSFCNLMSGVELPDGNYIGNIADIQIKTIKDESDDNFGRQIFLFVIEIEEEEFIGRFAIIPIILNPFHLEVRVGGDSELGRMLSNAEFSKRLIENLENAGAVSPFTNESLTAEIPGLIKLTVKIEIRGNGTSAKFKKLF